MSSGNQQKEKKTELCKLVLYQVYFVAGKDAELTTQHAKKDFTAAHANKSPKTKRHGKLSVP